jgi:late competence protein required for DNA uptake (superfamily II DNA/RNA helicase)
MKTPVYTHPDIENSHGEALPFFELTKKKCTRCHKGKLGIIAETRQTITFHCTVCDWMGSVKADDYREVQRLIKAGALPDPDDDEIKDAPAKTAPLSEL